MPTLDAIAARLAAHQPAPVTQAVEREAAVAIIIEEDDARALRFYLTKRASTLRRHGGQWALPGGRLDDGETPLEAAIRETEEEIGLSLPQSSLLGQLDPYLTTTGFAIFPFVFFGGTAPDLTPNPDEVARIHRFKLAELAAPTGFENDNGTLRLHLGGHRIHAPTAAMVGQFRAIGLLGEDFIHDHGQEPGWAK